MRTETTKQKGSVSYYEDGEEKTQEVMLTIVETYHDDGSKDVTVIVPRVSTRSSEKRGAP